MIARRIEFLLVCSLVLPTARFLEAQQAGYTDAQAASAIAALENLQLKQDKVTNCVDARTALNWKGVTIAYDEAGLQLSGTNGQRADWKATVPASGVFTCEVWAASLYKNSSPSLLILSGNHDPQGYRAELTILTFDPTGLPMPWRAVGRFSSNKSGIVQLIGPGDGNSALLVSTREGDRVDGYVYVHHLVLIDATGFTKVIGNKLSNNWPIITGNRKVLSGTETNGSLSEAFSDPYGQGEVITLNSIVSPGPSTGLGGIALSDGTHSMFPLMLEVNASDGSRNIYIAGDVPDILQTLTKKTYSARFVGQSCEEEECRPLLLIAMER